MRLRKLMEQDAPRMLQWMRDPAVIRGFRFPAMERTEADVLAFIRASAAEERNLHMAIAGEQDEYLGTVSLKNIDRDSLSAEYAIVLRSDAQGKGAGQFATREILTMAFVTLGLNRVYLNVLSDNLPAIRFYERFGFLREGVSKDALFINGEPRSLIWYRMLKSEFDCRTAGEAGPDIAHIRRVAFQERGDERGRLVIAECGKELPFLVRRIFYIYGSDGDVVRGRHANRRSSFVLINVSGSSKVRATDGRNECIYTLDRPYEGLYLPRMIWKEMYDFSRDSVLLVLSDELYDGGEYLRNYDEYIKEVRH